MQEGKAKKPPMRGMLNVQPKSKSTNAILEGNNKIAIQKIKEQIRINNDNKKNKKSQTSRGGTRIERRSPSTPRLEKDKSIGGDRGLSKIRSEFNEQEMLQSYHGELRREEAERLLIIESVDKNQQEDKNERDKKNVDKELKNRSGGINVNSSKTHTSMRAVGTFLLRKSNSKKGCYVISAVTEGLTGIQLTLNKKSKQQNIIEILRY